MIAFRLKRVFIFLIGLLAWDVPFLQGQTSDSTYQLIYQLPSKATFLTSDALQQLYIATENGSLLKLDKNGKLLFEYNNRRLGKVGAMDASNPFNILVYYPELATVLLLDRTLSEIKSINLFDLYIFEPQAVALSNDNNIWVYDPINFQLKKISKEGEVLFQSRPLQQTTNRIIQPNFLLERNNQLILSDTLNGIFIFDGFGQLERHIEIAGVARLQVVREHLLYEKNGVLFSYSLETSLGKKLFAIEHATSILWLSDQWLFIAKNEIRRLRITKSN